MQTELVRRHSTNEVIGGGKHEITVADSGSKEA